MSAPPDVDARVAELVGRLVEERTQALETRIAELTARLARVEAGRTSERVTMVVHSGDFDRLMAAFIIGTGSVAMGLEVSMFFTFWGLTAVKRSTTYAGKSFPEQMIAAMLPSGPDAVGTSRLNLLGAGPAFFKHVMKQHHVETLPDLIGLARELGVRMVACQMSMGIMGIRREELIEGLEYGGVATYLGDAADSKVTLFI